MPYSCTEMPLKQVILARTDLKLDKGKLSVQVAHASVEAVMKSDKEIVAKWRRQGMKKVVLKVNDEKELHQFQQAAKDQGLMTALITDAGKTAIPEGTVTCLAIGPDREEEIDLVTGKLKIL